MVKSNVEGKVRVYRKDREGKQPLYQVQLSHKNLDETWENTYICIQFRKGVEVADRADIEIKRAWLDFYKNKEGETVLYIKCIDFDICEDSKIPAWEDATTDVPF